MAEDAPTKFPGMRRLLWVTNEAPDRSRGGGNIRQAHLLEEVARHCDVTCVLYGEHITDQATLDSISSLVEVPLDPVPPLSRNRRRFNSVITLAHPRNPPEIASQRRARRALASALRTIARHDAVIFVHPGLAPLARRRSERRLLSLHHIESETSRALAAANQGRRRWLYERQASQERRLERWCVEYFDTVFTVSEQDAACLPAPTVVVENGVDLDRYVPSPVPSEQRVSLIGTLSYAPNVDGAVWFVNEVLPLIRNEVPGVQLDLVGRSPVPEVTALAQPPSINVIPDVPDIRQYYERTKVVVVPLRIGSGTRLKALEGMAASRPVVGTSVGLAGLRIENGKHALIADSPEALARSVVAVLRDNALATRLGEQGRTLVAAEYSWRRVSEPFVQAVLGSGAS